MGRGRLKMAGRQWPFALVLVLVLVALVVLPVPAARADASAEIHARLLAWAEAFNRRDAETACDLFSRELISIMPGQGEAGFATRCATITRALSDQTRQLRYAPEIHEIVVEGDLAVVRLDWTLAIEPGGEQAIETGLDVFRREDDGQWRIIRFISFEK